MALTRAPNTAAAQYIPVKWRALSGAWKVAFRIEPSGATTVRGRAEPSFFGVTVSSAHLSGSFVYAYV
jgi:hypothetical protein